MDSVAPPQKSRSGSERRKRSAPPLSIRVNDAERAEIEQAAARVSLTVGSYARSRLLANPTTKSRRKPSLDIKALTSLQGQMNRIGANIYLLRRDVSFGGTPTGDVVEAAFAGYREVIAAILDQLGRVPK